MIFIGAFGNVKLAWLKKDKNKMVAIKAMKKLDIIQSKHVDHIENEKKILEIMVHPFVVSKTLSILSIFKPFRCNISASCKMTDTSIL
jgi:serine/threonine protein kinase